MQSTVIAKFHILVCLAVMVACGSEETNGEKVTYDNEETTPQCSDENCNTACVTAGYPSGICSGGECECLSPPDSDGKDDADIDGGSDIDADGQGDADVDGDTDSDVSIDGGSAAAPDDDAGADIDSDADTDGDSGFPVNEDGGRDADGEGDGDAVGYGCDPFDRTTWSGECPDGQGCSQIRVDPGPGHGRPFVDHTQCVPTGFGRQGHRCTRFGEALGFAGIDSDPYGGTCAPGFICNGLCERYCRSDDDCTPDVTYDIGTRCELVRIPPSCIRDFS